MNRSAVVAVVLVVAAGAAAVAWWRHGLGGGEQGRAAPAVGSGVAPAPGSAKVVAPERPPVAPTPPVTGVAPSPPVRIVPPEGPEPAPPPGAGLGFDEEPRDGAWADDHEHELAQRLAVVVQGLAGRGVAVQVGPPECRRTLCRVSIAAADSAALGTLYGVLESEDGLYGWAETMLLQRVVTADDGRVETGIIAQFVRDEP